MPSSTILQLLILLTASGAFALAFQLGIRHMRARAAADESSLAGQQAGALGSGAVGALAAGIAMLALLLVWRSASEGEVFLRLNHHLDAFVAFGLILAGMLVYFRLTHHLRGFGFFLLPLICVVLLLGVVLTLLYRDQPWGAGSPALAVHVLSIMAGSVLFAAGCAGGIVYLLADRQLRHKGLDASHRFLALPALATMEKFNQTATLIGFPLLTVAMITGFARAYHQHLTAGSALPALPKVALAVLAWLVYAVVLHVRLAPSFRGRRAAWLSIIGFVLLLAVFITAYWWPRSDETASRGTAATGTSVAPAASSLQTS